jgi:hypothetical protein
MKRFLRLLTNWWVLSIGAAVLGALLLVLVLPLLVHELRPLSWRLTLLALVGLIWGVAALLRFLAARRAAARLANALAAESAKGGDEGALLAGRMKEAVAKLKADSGSRRNYLYTRPWYVIIGAPGSGKTTALLNSGLRFPFSDTALKGVGGTRNLDFFLSRPIYQEQGCLAAGFTDRFDKIVEPYSCAASPYWAAKGFTPLLLPPNLRDWVPADHLAQSLIEAVEAIELRKVRVNTRGTGCKAPPANSSTSCGESRSNRSSESWLSR